MPSSISVNWIFLNILQISLTLIGNYMPLFLSWGTWCAISVKFIFLIFLRTWMVFVANFTVLLNHTWSALFYFFFNFLNTRNWSKHFISCFHVLHWGLTFLTNSQNDWCFSCLIYWNLIFFFKHLSRVSCNWD